VVKDIIWEPGRTFGEFSLLTGYTPKNCLISDISLGTDLTGGLELRLPFLSAAMTSVTGYEMALALGREGGLGILPSRLSVEEQVGIVGKIKSYEMSFVDSPLTVRDDATIEDVLREIERHGHSKIPVVDRNNVFRGIFVREHYWAADAEVGDKVSSVMIAFDKANNDIPYSAKPGLTVDEAKQLFDGKSNYVVVLDNQDRLVKLAFRKDVEQVRVGSAISTHEGWMERVEANLEAGVDLILIDTSDGHTEFVGELISQYKNMGTDVPICAGNVITYDGALFLMEQGVDIVKAGMSSGSICTTQHEKAVGRGPMTALLEVQRARESFSTNRYVPLIVDGGVSSSADMIIALTVADAIMMGNYFNGFFEAAGEKIDGNGAETTFEPDMKEVRTWGEGSDRARNLGRYGHSSRRTFFAEGVEGTVLYMGRLKPNIKIDTMKIRSAMSNAGCKTLKDFRDNAVLELNSPFTSMVVSNVHDVKGKS